MVDKQPPLPEPDGPDEPMTEAEFLARLDALVAAGKSAGIRHVPFMVARHMTRKGADFLGNILDAVDDAYNKRRNR